MDKIAEFVFTPGKLTTILDAQAGSSGKGVIGSYVCEHADNWQFCCNTFMPQAGHWVKLDDGRSFFYQTFNSCAYNHSKFEKMYIAPGATIELKAFWRELEENGIPRSKIGISPITAILQESDTNYEKGTHDFAGMALNDDLFGNNDRVSGGPLASSGTTAHGCGANRAKRVLRSKGSLFARDIPELKEFICDVPTEIMKRLDAGQAGLLEIAQGFQLSNMLANFYPHVTSRNCTVAAGLDDLMVPPYYAGNVILNVRTYPIRINSNKWVDKKTGRHLTQEEVKKFDEEVKASWATNNNEHGMELPYRKVLGNSGHGYPDQKEITWEELTEQSGSREPLMEITSVTKLPRRVFTFSKINLDEAIRHNQTNGYTIISVNFMNYVDAGMFGKRGKAYGIDDTIFTEKTVAWMKENLGSLWNRVRFIGTGPNTDDKIFIV